MTATDCPSRSRWTSSWAEKSWKCPCQPSWRPAAYTRRSISTCKPHNLNELAALARSEEHTSELQSRQYLVCRLLLEKNKTQNRSGGQPSTTKLPYPASALRDSA